MKLLITGAWNCTEEELIAINNMGHSVILMQDESGALPDGALECEGIICNGFFLYHDIDKFKFLKYIQLTSAGYDRIPMDKIKSRGITVFNARGVYSIPMAEFALCGVLQLYKKSNSFYRSQENKKWEKRRDILELYGKNVLIVGCGNVGTECANRFKAFGCRVIGVDLYIREDNAYEKIYPISELDNCLLKVDIVVLTLPLTKETRHIMNEQRFAKMREGSVLVNIARGAVLDEKALLKALDEKLLGAVLDVFEEEPLSHSNPFWNKDNLIITPHNSFVGDGNAERLKQVILSSLGEKYEKRRNANC